MNKKYKEKIAANVVTYNRKDLLSECLNALINQSRKLDAIYIIDNDSTDGTFEFLRESGYIHEINRATEKIVESIKTKKGVEIHYVKMLQNTGSAGGQYEGVKRAYKKGFDWIWVMDDDAIPMKDALEKLSKYFYIKNLSALAGKVINIDKKICVGHRGKLNFKGFPSYINKPITQKEYKKNSILNIDFASFVGILISKKSISKIGYPKKEFFIHDDDVEYCIRLRQVGKLILVPESVICHKEARNKNLISKKLLWKHFLRVPYKKFWINYYGIRNRIYLGKKYSTNRLRFYFGVRINYLKSIILIILLDNFKIKRIVFMNNAYMDGLNNTFNNEKPKRILYLRGKKR